jgi:hypothetical protein
MKKLGVKALLILFMAFSAIGFAGGEKVKPLSGAFFQINGAIANMNYDEMYKELESMRNIGMDTIIVQYSAYNDVYYYPSKYKETSDELFADESLTSISWNGKVRSRYVKISLEVPAGIEWVITPEIQVMYDSKTVLEGCSYTVNPNPASQYSDANNKLIDGKFRYSWEDMVGWQNKKNIDVTFDLKSEKDIDFINIMFMNSKVSGVSVPKNGYKVSFSSDGSTFSSAVAVVPDMNKPKDENYGDVIGNILKAADVFDMNVYLGLALDSSYWEGKMDPQAQAVYNKNIMGELYSMYKSHKSLAGWYLPEEIDDRNFLTKERKDAIVYYLKQMSSYAKMLTKKPVMISPYFGINPDGNAYALFWEEIFKQAKIDIFAMQDGVGTKRTTAQESSEVFKALKPVMDKYGVKFWANLEVFEQTHGWPVDDKAWQSTTAKIERVKAQMELMSPYVEKCVIFDYPSYMSPRLENPLYDNYAKYYQEIK